MKYLTFDKFNVHGDRCGFTRFCSKVFDVFLLGLLWFICSIPLVTIGASTTALYYAMVHSVSRTTATRPPRSLNFQ